MIKRLEKNHLYGILMRKHLSIGRNPGEPCEIHGLSRNCEPHGAASQIPAPFKFPPPEAELCPEHKTGKHRGQSVRRRTGVMDGLTAVVFMCLRSCT